MCLCMYSTLAIRTHNSMHYIRICISDLLYVRTYVHVCTSSTLTVSTRTSLDLSILMASWWETFRRLCPFTSNSSSPTYMHVRTLYYLTTYMYVRNIIPIQLPTLSYMHMYNVYYVVIVRTGFVHISYLNKITMVN